MSHPNLQEAIITTAFQDHDFLMQLRDDPKHAIAGRFGVDLPSHVNVHLVGETDSDVYIVLPHALNGGIEDAELEQFAAGYHQAVDFVESQGTSFVESAGAVVKVGIEPTADCGCGGGSLYTSVYPTQACSPGCYGPSLNT